MKTPFLKSAFFDHKRVLSYFCFLLLFGLSSPIGYSQDTNPGCSIYFSISFSGTLPGGGSYGDILVYNPGGDPYVLPGGSNRDLTRNFLGAFAGVPQPENVGLKDFDILSLDYNTDPAAALHHKILFTVNNGFTVANPNHQWYGQSVTGGDLLLSNGGIILNSVLIPPLDLRSVTGAPVQSLGIDAVETIGLASVFDKLEHLAISSPGVLREFVGNNTLRILFSFESNNDEYFAGSNSLLPEGTLISADDLLEMVFTPNGTIARVVRSGVDGVPQVPNILEGYSLKQNHGLDAVSLCAANGDSNGEYIWFYFSTNTDGESRTSPFTNGDVILHNLSDHTNSIMASNIQLIGNDKQWGLDGLDLYPERYPQPPSTSTPTPTPTITPTQPSTLPPTSTPQTPPTATPIPVEKSPTPTFTPREGETPLPTKTATPKPTLSVSGLSDDIIITQGLGGINNVNIRNFDKEIGLLTSVMRSFYALPDPFLKIIGGGKGRNTYISTGDLNNDGTPDIVLTFGPITEAAKNPNIVVPRNSLTKQIVGHTFEAFPTGTGRPVNYNGGEIRTAIGDFIGSGVPQIACAQGWGGKGIVRLFQYTGLPAPNGWKIMGQFEGLSADLQKLNANGGVTLAAGDLDRDGYDELVVGQTNSNTSQTMFQVLDINPDGQVAERHTYQAFPKQFVGDGGAEYAVADLNGDGFKEIIAASQGNSGNHGDERDKAKINLISIILPVVEKGRIIGFKRPTTSVLGDLFKNTENPSGALSLAVGELNGNQADGDEVLIGTGCLYETPSQLLFSAQDASPKAVKIQAVKPAPEARYRPLKISFDGERVSGFKSVVGTASGFRAFAGDFNPSSGAIYVGIFKKFRPINPTDTLMMNGFKLAVASYDNYHYDYTNKIFTNVSGYAWTSFKCEEPLILIPGWADLVLAERKFLVVDFVRDPIREINVVQAQAIFGQVEIGDSLLLNLPNDIEITQSITKNDFSNILQVNPDLLGSILKKKGNIKVRFENLTVVPDFQKNLGAVTAGTARYPTTPPSPAQIQLSEVGFKVLIDGLLIAPTITHATAELEFPPSIISGESCRPGHVSLGYIEITHDCQFYGEYLSQPYGPWTLDNTGMKIQGPGFVADFSNTVNWSGLGASPLPVTWEGVVLPSGETIPESTPPISNTGYLAAKYDFNTGLVAENGLTANFQLSQPFLFYPLQPLGYTVSLRTGMLFMIDSHISFGNFYNGEIVLPKQAVLDPTDHEIKAQYSQLTVQNDLDLFGDVTLSQDMKWGEYIRSSVHPTYYQGIHPNNAAFYLSGTYKPTFYPLDAGGNFSDLTSLGTVADTLEGRNVQGVTVFGFNRFVVLTSDTPGQAPIYFEYTGFSSWLNVISQGVNARLSLLRRLDPKLLLGPTYQTFYVSKDSTGVKVPFTTEITNDNQEKSVAVFRFVDSAVYSSDAGGSVRLEGPIKSNVPFKELQFTSTAQISGAKVDLSSPITMDYWGTQMVQQTGMTSAGVISVRTGQMFLTAAGIAEYRHYDRPFYLTWGELWSTGDIGRLVFDYNYAGQKFDGFTFVQEAVGLSPYDAGDVNKEKAFLQAGGRAYIDFFGEDYLNIKDFNYIAKPTAPFNSRRIEFAFDNAYGTQPTDVHIARDWGNHYSSMEFDIQYDSSDQDGFLGTGQVGLTILESGTLSSTIDIDRNESCISMNEINRHDFTLGPVAHFGSMSRINGCACIKAGVLERIHISAQLENAGNVNVLLRSATYGSVEFDLTPTISQMWISGDMYLSLLIGADIEAKGQAHFLVNRDEAYTEGDIEGSISTSSLAGGLDADGRLEWHMGAFTSLDSYHSIQGRVAVQVMAPIGSTGAEGGFYVGINAPKSNAWVLQDKDSRFKLNMAPLPDRLTGVYGYVKTGSSINLYIVSGGYEVYAGMGLFVDLGTHPGKNSGIPGVPYVVGNFGVHVWGDILGGLVSAGAWGDFNIIAPYPFSFDGTLGLEACVLWVFCGSVDINVGVNSSEGFYLR